MPVIFTRLYSLIPAVMLLMGCHQQEPLQQKQTGTPAVTAPSAKSALLATIADNEAPDARDSGSSHLQSAGSGSNAPQIVAAFSTSGTGVAYAARTGDQVHVVHNGQTGKNYKEIDSLTLAISPDGKRVAYCAKQGDKWLVIVDGKEFGPYDDKGAPVFSPDSRHVAYEAQIGGKWYIFSDGSRSPGAFSFFDKPVYSGDSQRLLRIENTPANKSYRYVLSDLDFGHEVVREVQTPDKRIDQKLSKVAVIDKLAQRNMVRQFGFQRADTVSTGKDYDEIRHPVFSDDGRHLAYLAKNKGRNYLVLDGREAEIPDGEYPWPPTIRPNGEGASVIIDGKNSAYVHQAFHDDGIRPPGAYKECAELVYSKDGRSHAYVAIRNEKFLIVTNGKEGPFYDRVISPTFSPDGKFLVYRARQNDKRFVVIADAATGSVIRELPRHERVFETAFSADGTSVAYGVKDGNQLLWKVEKL